MPSLSLPHNLWETVKCDFKSLFPEDVFQMWFEPVVCIETSEDSITLGVPNDFAAIWIHDNYLDLITQRLRLTAGRPVSVNLQKTEGAPRGMGAHRASESAAPAARTRATGVRRLARGDERGPAPGTLNIR
ncbi:MAG TPA: DnaA N-terminal domain-containing protein, partial [Opitutaceae bacterium]|nr:DnaA N-terminal domain-containing protein [Opitutaceae bacterium]